MILGRVDVRRQSLVELTVHSGESITESVIFLLDTGFNGAVMLPKVQVVALKLPEVDAVTIRLADGSRVSGPVYSAQIDWMGTERAVEVVASGKQPLLGTALLEGSKLEIEMKVGGQVILQPL